MTRDSDQFIQDLTAGQTSLYGYILSLLPDRAAAQDVLQEVNLTAWQKRGGARTRERPQEGIRLTFRSSTHYWQESLSFGINAQLHARIQSHAQGGFNSPAIVPDEQSLLWIGKIIRRADGEDEVSFRIYGQSDALDYAEPATWHVASRGLHQSAALDLVVISSTGKSPRMVDELRIGPTWRSVVPIRTSLAVAQ